MGRALLIAGALALVACSAAATPTAAPPANPTPTAAATPAVASPTAATAAKPAATVPAAAAPTNTPAAVPAAKPGPEGTPAPKPAEPTKPTKPAAPTTAAAMPKPADAAAAKPVAVSTLPAPTAAAKPAGTLKVEAVVKGLDTPWAIAFHPDGRWFVTERPGRIRIVKDGQLLPEPWMTFDVFERDQSEAGLLGIALDGQYVYVAYTYPAGNRLQNRLVRLREEQGKGVQDKVLFDGVLGNQNHDGGRVKIGPDGKLYWTMGESFIRNLAQDRESPSGKILRLNTDGSVPADNPFPGSPIWSWGHRNPQGIAWQPGTGRLYETEHGPSGQAEAGCCHDEVNLIEPGKNYGWPTIRGDQAQDGLVSPLLHSGPSVTWAPGGAAFATSGPWAGSLLFAGLRGTALYRVTFDQAGKATLAETLLEREYGRLRDVVEGPDGALYVLTSNRDGRGQPTPDDDRVLRLGFG
jgi:glucose/arabinose dehydrogenase